MELAKAAGDRPRNSWNFLTWAFFIGALLSLSQLLSGRAEASEIGGSQPDSTDGAANSGNLPNALTSIASVGSETGAAAGGAVASSVGTAASAAGFDVAQPVAQVAGDIAGGAGASSATGGSGSLGDTQALASSGSGVSLTGGGSIVTDILNQTINVIENVTDTVVNVVQDILKEVTNVLEDVTTIVKDIVNELVSEVTNVVENVSEVVNDVVSDVTNVVENVTEVVGGVLDDATGAVGTVLDLAESATAPVMELVDEVTGQLEPVLETAMGVADELTAPVTDALQGVLAEAAPVVDTVTGLLGEAAAPLMDLIPAELQQGLLSADLGLGTEALLPGGPGLDIAGSAGLLSATGLMSFADAPGLGTSSQDFDLGSADHDSFPIAVAGDLTGDQAAASVDAFGTTLVDTADLTDPTSLVSPLEDLEDIASDPTAAVETLLADADVSGSNLDDLASNPTAAVETLFGDADGTVSGSLEDLASNPTAVVESLLAGEAGASSEPGFDLLGDAGLVSAGSPLAFADATPLDSGGDLYTSITGGFSDYGLALQSESLPSSADAGALAGGNALIDDLDTTVADLPDADTIQSAVIADSVLNSATSLFGSHGLL